MRALLFYITALLWAAIAVGVFFVVAISVAGTPSGKASLDAIAHITSVLLLVAMPWSLFFLMGLPVRRRIRELPPVGAAHTEELAFPEVFLPKCRCPKCKSADYHQMRAPRTEFSAEEIKEALDHMPIGSKPQKEKYQSQTCPARTRLEHEANRALRQYLADEYETALKEYENSRRRRALQLLETRENAHELWRTCSECEHVWGQDVELAGVVVQ